MKILWITNKFLAMALVASVCLSLSVANAEPLPEFQVAEVHTFSDGAPTTSAGTLLRKKNEVWARLAMHGLEADSVYTVWWVIFNHPGNCAAGPGLCSGGDLGDLAVNASRPHAAGFITSASGSANITAHLEAGRLPQGLQVHNSEDGLLRGNGYRAEIHMVFLNHGPAVDLEGEIGPHISTTPGGMAEYAIVFLAVD